MYSFKANINEDIKSTIILARNKGYNKWIDDSGLDSEDHDEVVNEVLDELTPTSITEDQLVCLELCMIAKYLRDVCKMHVAVGPNWSVRIDYLDEYKQVKDDTFPGGTVKIYKHDHVTSNNGDEIFYGSFEEALLYGIRYALNKLK